jgi:hypothetical protein
VHRQLSTCSVVTVVMQDLLRGCGCTAAQLHIHLQALPAELSELWLVLLIQPQPPGRQ